MADFRINFKLKPPAEIAPWGENRDHLSWFGLTDSDLWITVGERTIYEYAEAAPEQWKDFKVSRYNDYQLSRFLEDFSRTFAHIRESIPERFYNEIENFYGVTHEWLEGFPDGEDDDDTEEFDRFYDEQYEPLTEWFHSRVFDSGHLIGGPLIGCFRCGENIKIWWDSGSDIWTAPSGIYELPYREFVGEVKRFFGEFYEEMDEQVRISLVMDWGKVQLDKKYLAEEHEKRKIGFKAAVSLLDELCFETDWERVNEIYERMLSAE